MKNITLVSLIFCTLLAGCQPKVYLMPPPVSLNPGNPVFSMGEANQDENLLYTLYATNRLPYDKADKSLHYTILPSDTLRIGFVVHSVGGNKLSWDNFYYHSLQSKREKNLLLRQEYVRELAQYDKDDDLQRTSAMAEGFFDQINKVLARNFDKDIVVYVHGANSNFYRATAQGAQYYHYTGHNSIVLTFSWPSAENIFRYKTDVFHARKTIPAFVKLLEVLARHTDARNINILAYSAGAQVVAPGLASLRDHYPELSPEELKKKLRIGEVYLAAPDTALVPFVGRYSKFKDIVQRTTINLNGNDTILRLAAMQNGVSRLGRPDTSELSKEEVKIMTEALNTPQLDVIDVGGSESLRLGGAHDSWYSHPWVSNDLLLLFLFNASPLERGLQEYVNNGGKAYRFPTDYDQKIKKILDAEKDVFWEKYEALQKTKQ